MQRLALSGLIVSALAACATTPPGEKPVEVVRGPVPVRAVTPLEEALRCLANHVPEELDLRLAVFRVPDRTGVVDYDSVGSYVTQAAELMLVTAIAKTGVRQVNRTATNVTEWELQQALEKRLGEGRPVPVDGRQYPFRPIRLGQLLGSTHTVYGAITELDFDILSDGAEVSVLGVGGKGRGYYISVAMDVVVSDSRTTEIVTARSYRKQIWGQEIEANLFRFFDVNPNGNGGFNTPGIELFDIRVGQQKNEPIHASLRWMAEQAAYEIVRDLAGVGPVCDALVPEQSRSEPQMLLAAGRVPAVQPATGGAAVPEQEILPEAGGGGAQAPEAAAPRPLTPNGEPTAPRAVRLPGGTVLPVETPQEP